MNKVKLVLAVLLVLNLGSCSSLLSSALPIPNPLEADKGINTDVAIGQNVTTTKKKQLIEVTVDDIGRDNSVSSNNATSMTNNYTNINWWLIAVLIFLGGLVIPSRGQYKMNQKLREDLEYERNKER